MYLQMVAPCLLGLEGLVSDELKQMDAQNVCAENGRVFFEGDENIVARANINSRYGERILIVLDRFKAVTFEELFQGVKALPWSEFIGSSDTFPVIVPSIVVASCPVSSETTMVKASVTSLIPRAARCLEPYC